MKIINVGSRAMNTWLYAVSDGWVMVDTGYPESMGRVIHRGSVRGFSRKR